MTKYEAAVIGAGPTGLAAALALARMGIEVALVGPGVRPCGSDPIAATADQRTTALMLPSLNLLKNLGAMGVATMGSDPQGLTPIAPISAVRIADADTEAARNAQPEIGDRVAAEIIAERDNAPMAAHLASICLTACDFDARAPVVTPARLA